MNRIILIGNGFDLAHGLPTSYKNFIDDYWEKFIKAARRNSKIFENESVRLTSKTRNIDVVLSSEKKEFTIERIQNDIKSFNTGVYGGLSNGVSFNVKNKFLKHISTKCNFNNWVDIENEYYNFLCYPIKKRKISENYFYGDIKELNSHFEIVKNNLESYLIEVLSNNKVKFLDNIQSIIYSDFNKNDFTNYGIQFLNNNVEKITPEKLLILNFNYTNLENLYIKDWNTKVIHIHGELNYKKNPIIFGYGDEIGDEYMEIEKLYDNNFLENIKSIKYHETDNYKRLLDYINTETYQIFILGHSCGNSDRTLLNTLFEHRNCVSIKIFYHKRIDKTDNYSDVIRNISRNFNDKKMLREKVVNKQYSEPLL